MKRRSRGEGTIFKRDDGLWTARVTLPNGKRRTKYARSQKEVRDWLVEQQNASRMGTWTEHQSLTVAEFMRRYLGDVVAHTLRPATQDSYTFLTQKHIVPDLGNIRLVNLRPQHLQAFYAGKLKAGYSRRTVQYLHSIVHKALSQAVRWDLVPRNVADAVDAPRPTKKAPEMLTAAQAKQLLDCAKSDLLYPAWLTAISTGMRKEEILGLRWADVDLDAGTIHVSQVAITVYKKGMVVGEPKTEKSRRSIGLPPVTVEALKAHRERQAKYFEYAAFKDQGLVFPTKRGTPIGSRNLLRYFHEALQRAELPRVSFHSLRHLHATMLLSANLHPKIVQSRLGHSNIGMTMDLYSHIMPGMDQKATEEIEKALGNS